MNNTKKHKRSWSVRIKTLLPPPYDKYVNNYVVHFYRTKRTFYVVEGSRSGVPKRKFGYAIKHIVEVSVRENKIKGQI